MSKFVFIKKYWDQRSNKVGNSGHLAQMERKRVQDFGLIFRREETANIITRNNFEMEARAVMWESAERIKEDQYILSWLRGDTEDPPDPIKAGEFL
jgi:hypothetical protein